MANRILARRANTTTSNQLARQPTVPPLATGRKIPQRLATFPRAEFEKTQAEVSFGDFVRSKLQGGEMQRTASAGSSLAEDFHVMSDADQDSEVLSPEGAAERKFPQTPDTADIFTENPALFRMYQYRLEDLEPEEIIWFGRVKKLEATDASDSSNMAARSRPTSRQFSVFPINNTDNSQYEDLPNTDCFGKIYFPGEKTAGIFPSWFLRTAVSMPTNVVQELLEKLEILNRDGCAVRIHCIDYDRWPVNIEVPKYPESAPNPTSNQDPNIKVDINEAIRHMGKDLRNICRKTAGLVLTWSGMQYSMVHDVLVEFLKQNWQNVTNFATIATPPWTALEPLLQGQFFTKGEDVHLQFPHIGVEVEERDSEEQPSFDILSKRHGLGKEVSAYASHFLFLDDKSSPDEPLGTKAEKRNFRHFHYRLIDAMDNYGQGAESPGPEMPVVCVLFNGCLDALKMVVFALTKGIPVLVVKGSGGLADVIADVYLNSELDTVKDRDRKTDRVYTIVKKKVGEIGDWYEKKLFPALSSLSSPVSTQKKKQEEEARLLREVFSNLHRLTIYWPHTSIQNLDSCIFEALLKNKQEVKFKGLVEIMKQALRCHRPAGSPTSTEQESLLESDEQQMDFFIEAMKQNCVDVVKAFLDDIEIHKKFTTLLHMGHILRLYTQANREKDTLINYRQKLQKRLKSVTQFPLRCHCQGCVNCDVKVTIETPMLALQKRRTCLHPIQELFLWSLHEELVDIALIFWERCDDKIAAALFAQKVFNSAAKECEDPDAKWQMHENVKRFQGLAIQTLKSCHQMDELFTEQILTKPCPWWGNVSILQLAIMTHNSEFVAQTACQNIMTRIWHGQPPSDPTRPKRPCEIVDNGPKMSGHSKCSSLPLARPVVKYTFSFVMQVLFLALFSCSLLSSLGQRPTPIFIVVMIWVGAITWEELRQFFSEDPVVAKSKLKRKSSFFRKLTVYKKQDWNTVDIITIVLFWLGMLVFAPYDVLHVLGRFLLSVDIFFFFVRIFQMLMVFDELGLMVVMVYKMFKDTRNFMIILLIFVLGYAVASESLLYPESPVTWQRAFHLPRKGYWHVFGEFLLDEIELRENSSCSSMTESKYYGHDSTPCPSQSGSYIVPILLGIHVMITNVLLLNLLIARFGVTFNKVHDDAQQHQSWQRCLIITEYYSRESIPPPFNIFYTLCLHAWQLVCKVCCCCASCFTCCCRKERSQQAGSAQENIPLQPRAAVYSVKARRSADGRSIHIKWKRNMPSSKLKEFVKSHRNRADQLEFEVSLNREHAVDQLQGTTTPAQTPTREEIKFMVRGGDRVKQSFSVWDLDRDSDYTVAVERCQAELTETLSSWSRRELIEIMSFEDEQALYVRGHEDPETSLLKDLKERFDSLKQEISKVASDVKDKTDSLKESFYRNNNNQDNLEKKLKKLTDKCTKAFGSIQKNFQTLEKFLSKIECHNEAVEVKKKDCEEREQNKKAMTEAGLANQAAGRNGLEMEHYTVQLRHLEDKIEQQQPQMQELQARVDRLHTEQHQQSLLLQQILTAVSRQCRTEAKDGDSVHEVPC